jgi:hypothetical protein
MKFKKYFSKIIYKHKIEILERLEEKFGEGGEKRFCFSCKS